MTLKETFEKLRELVGSDLDNVDLREFMAEIRGCDHCDGLMEIIEELRAEVAHLKSPATLREKAAKLAWVTVGNKQRCVARVMSSQVYMQGWTSLFKDPVKLVQDLRANGYTVDISMLPEDVQALLANEQTGEFP